MRCWWSRKKRVKRCRRECKRLTGHHWVTHSAIVLIVFGFFGWVFARANGGRGVQMSVNRLIGMLVAGVVAGGLVIVGFYLIGD